MKEVNNLTKEEFDIIVRKEIECELIQLEKIKGTGVFEDDIVYTDGDYYLAFYSESEKRGYISQGSFLKTYKSMKSRSIKNVKIKKSEIDMLLEGCQYNECEYNYDGECIPDNTYTKNKCRDKGDDE